MGNEIQDGLIEEMLSIPPLCHRITRRKLVKATTNTGVDISLPLFMIMRVLEEEGTLHIAEIGERLLIPRPQMTHMIDKLVKLKIVSRDTDQTDRRTINVELTRNGRKVLEDFKRAVRSSIKIDMSCLTEEELQDLPILLRKLKDILSKL